MSRTRRMKNRRSERSKRGGMKGMSYVDVDEDKIIETLLNAKDNKGNLRFTEAERDSFLTDANFRNKIILLVKTYKVEYPSYVIIGAIASALKRNKGINVFFEYDEKNDKYTDVISSHDADHYFKKYRKHHWDDEKEREWDDEKEREVRLQGEAPVMGGKSRRRSRSRSRSHRRSRRGANKKSRKGRKSRKSRKVRKSRCSRR